MINDQEEEKDSKAKSYEVLAGVTPKDPYSWGNIVLTVFKSVGYPMEFTEGGCDRDGKESFELLQVKVDTQKTREKIYKVYEENYHYDVLHLLKDVDHGFVTNIVYCLQGNFEGAYKESTMNSSDESQIEIEMLPDPRMKQVLEECFMQSYERARRRDDVLGIDHEKKTYPNAQKQRDLYSQLKEKGIKPIGVEAVRGMYMMVLNDILEKYPELGPHTND